MNNGWIFYNYVVNFNLLRMDLKQDINLKLIFKIKLFNGMGMYIFKY